jgi:hypothetical protein
LRLLGSYYDANGDVRRARRYHSLAHAISRRDEATELWRAIDAGRRGNAPEAIAAIDTVLRTSSSAGPLIFPMFEQIIANPEAPAALAPYVRAHRVWLNSLAETLLAKPQNAGPLADVFAPDPSSLNDGLRAQLLGSLLVTGERDRLVRIYKAFPETDPRVLTNVGFQDPFVDQRYIPMTWQMLPTTTVDAGFVRTGRKARVFEIGAFGRAYEAVLAKALILEPGAYRLAAKVRISDGNQRVLSWDVKCRSGSGQPLSVARLPIGGGRFLVPDDCPFVILSLQIDNPDGQGIEAVVEDASLTAS